jgi:hypothetical protein
MSNPRLGSDASAGRREVQWRHRLATEVDCGARSTRFRSRRRDRSRSSEARTGLSATCVRRASHAAGADDAVVGLQHAVTLQSLEEDRLGQELRVIWELEPGRSLRPDLGLPTHIEATTFDDPNRLAAFIDAFRWGAITSADSQVVQAPFRSGSGATSR